LDLSLLNTDNLSLFIGFFLGSSYFNSDFLDVLFESGDIFLSSLKLDATRVILLSLSFNGTFLSFQHSLEEGDELEERLRSCVNSSPFLDHDQFRKLSDLREGERHELNNTFSDFIAVHFNVS
jgi:hypothetical protein